MSDRQATNDALMAYANQRGCDGITVAHETNSHNDTTSRPGQVSAEHGPYEGAGFYQDMVLVSQARHGLVATTRSSSALLQEIMLYDHDMRQWNSNSSFWNELEFVSTSIKVPIELIGNTTEKRGEKDCNIALESMVDPPGPWMITSPIPCRACQQLCGAQPTHNSLTPPEKENNSCCRRIS